MKLQFMQLKDLKIEKVFGVGNPLGIITFSMNSMIPINLLLRK
jgi:hypothetical protein